MGISFIKPPRSFRVRYRNQFWYAVKVRIFMLSETVYISNYLFVVFLFVYKLNNKCKDDVNRRENTLAEKNKEQLYDAYIVLYIIETCWQRKNITENRMNIFKNKVLSLF